MNTYIFNKRKKSRVYHIGTLQHSLCKLHHSAAWKQIDTITNTPPADRQLCSMCESLHKQGLTSKPTIGKHNTFYSSFEWRKLRYEILKESDHRCACCGTSTHDGAALTVDHIKPIRHFPHLALDKQNLQVLCRTCNIGKGSWDETDWR
jgi:HNH endonuclease